MADIQDAELEAAEAQLAALNTQLSTLETGTPGASGTDGDVLASMRQLRSTLVADTDEATATEANRDQLAEEVATLEKDNSKLTNQISHLKAALAEPGPA